MTQPPGLVELFLAGADVVCTAISDPLVAQQWDQPSVLQDQLVSGLAGHLARGGVWVVADYLDAGTPDTPVAFESAGEYFAHFVSVASPGDHEAIRARGADVAAVGHANLARELGQRLAALKPRLRSLDAGHPIAVAGGNVMRLSDYLTTRIVEQVVHLDDLARSLSRSPWHLPDGATDLVIAVGTDIARHRAGDNDVVRALFREGSADAILPVI